MPADLLETTLATASIGGVTFPVGAVSAKSGHTIVRHRAYRTRGADLEPTGQKEFEGSITAILLNDLVGWPELYPGRYSDLVRVLEDNPIVEFWHPFKGQMQVGIEEWDERFDPDVRNGCYIDIRWTEHNATASTLIAADGSPNTDSTQRATTQAAASDTAGASVTGYTPVAPVIATQLGVLAGASLTALQITAALNTMSAAIAANLALPGMAAITALDALIALETLRATVNAMSTLYLGAKKNTSLVTLPSDMPLWEVSQWVYRDASMGSLILAANSIGNPNLIRAGTTLTILPE